MWRGVIKGACGPLAGDTPRIGTKGQIGFRKSRENAKEQVGVQGLIKRYSSNGLHTRTSGLHWLSVLSSPIPGSAGPVGSVPIFRQKKLPRC